MDHAGNPSLCTLLITVTNNFPTILIRLTTNTKYLNDDATPTILVKVAGAAPQPGEPIELHDGAGCASVRDSSTIASAGAGAFTVTTLTSTSNTFSVLHVPSGICSDPLTYTFLPTIPVVSITSNDGAFAALRLDGSVVTWGIHWGNSFGVPLIP